tara:strand:- start:9566 stop:10192 length:627 start_codon:yes stop_codon:yes gene_type:complete
MNKNLTDLTVIIDRSGSMYSCKDEAEGGVNQLIDDQKKEEGKCNFTLAQFDTEYELVNDGTPINEVESFTLVPRGGTALLDAIGKTVASVGERLAKMDEKDRPGLVSVVIVTDGHENSSNEFTKSQIKEIIDEQTNKYSWKFSFLGANQDAFAEATSMGIHTSASYSTSKSHEAFSGISGQTSRMRSATKSGGIVSADYTASELKSMK